MKNFDQFQHQSLNESIVNKVLGAAKKVAQNTVGASGTARTRYGPNAVSYTHLTLPTTPYV